MFIKVIKDGSAAFDARTDGPRFMRAALEFQDDPVDLLYCLTKQQVGVGNCQHRKATPQHLMSPKPALQLITPTAAISSCMFTLHIKLTRLCWLPYDSAAAAAAAAIPAASAACYCLETNHANV
jgi:hypothetical protein